MGMYGNNIIIFMKGKESIIFTKKSIPAAYCRNLKSQIFGFPYPGFYNRESIGGRFVY
jgi:hypothetical protein